MHESTKINILLAVSVLILIGVAYIGYKVTTRTPFAYGMRNEMYQMKQNNFKQGRMNGGQFNKGMRGMGQQQGRNNGNCPYMNQVQ